MKMYQTPMNIKDRLTSDWYLIDATNVVLGRLASKVAILLRGKDKPYFNPSVSCGANVVIINANKIKLTGNKLYDKKYYNHSQYPSGLRVRTANIMISKNASEVIEKAVYGMLPHTSLGRRQFNRLHVYNNNLHPHQAQNPQFIAVSIEK